jgi:predicted glutamine amidotransferase
MCQITLANFHDERVNKMFFLLAGSAGSIVHDDGWGFRQAGEPAYRCSLPMFYTLEAGEILATTGSRENTSPLLGHIRQASPKVPVTEENAHPFILEDVTFVHNGKLIPEDEKKFVMEIEIDEPDKKDPEKVVKKTVSRSDSLIFFEHFMSFYEKSEEENPQKKFVECLNSAMNDFSGKFAMVFLIGETYYVVRGRTADLYISYQVDWEDETKVNGWAINTDKKNLEWSTNLLSNLLCLEDGTSPMRFTEPKLLEQESIFVAEDLGLTLIGTVKEKWPVTTSYTTYAQPYKGAGNFQSGGTSGTTTTNKLGKSPAAKYAEKVYNFMVEYSLSPQDISNLLLASYDISVVEAEEHIIKNFCEEVIPEIRKLTSKSIRKTFKKRLIAGFPIYRYTKAHQYPWMFNDKTIQLSLLEEVTTKKS